MSSITIMPSKSSQLISSIKIYMKHIDRNLDSIKENINFIENDMESIKSFKGKLPDDEINILRSKFIDSFCDLIHILDYRRKSLVEVRNNLVDMCCKDDDDDNDDDDNDVDKDEDEDEDDDEDKNDDDPIKTCAFKEIHCYYPDSQQKKYFGRITTVDGKNLKQGLWTFWDKDGNVTKTINFCDNYREGKCTKIVGHNRVKTTYYSNGNLIYESPINWSIQPALCCEDPEFKDL